MKDLKELKFEDILLILALFFTMLLGGCGKGQDFAVSNGKQNVLVIGDSISIGWMPFLAIKTEQKFNWYRLTAGGYGQNFTWPENARNTNYTLRNVNQWLNERPQMDVVFWNNGVWNCTQYGYVTPGEDPRNYGTTPAQYESELIQIAQILKARVPRVIFNTTTNCKGTNAGETDHGAEAFNEIAKRVLPGMGIEVFDLYSFVKDHDGQNGHDQWWINDSDVHFNGFGNEYISEELIKLLHVR